jgi:hypothetical protein
MDVLFWMIIPLSSRSGNVAMYGFRVSGSRFRREKWCIVPPASKNCTEDEEIRGESWNRVYPNYLREEFE